MSADPLQLLDDCEKFIELMTGVKAKWLAAGWTARGAEEMTLEMMRSSQGNKA